MAIIAENFYSILGADLGGLLLIAIRNPVLYRALTSYPRDNVCKFK